ncbi:PAS domain-containing sensor histidine kinase [Haloplanus aerogenes]|uniref:histidine kinase n=1 Tax=Haloplanus aerogenes TaxID=660522 RepID=A0A3G8R099_9EURY|nr:PAS domain-containing sensor histidine kinase [Haloplanus aerogenes]
MLLDQSQDKISLIDEHGTFTYVNGAVRRILGFDPADLVGETAFEYIHPDDVETIRRVFERTLRSESFTEATVEYRFRAADDSWVWLESRMSNLTDTELDGFVVSSRDVTDRVRAEHEYAETASRLEEIAAASGDALWMFNADWSELLFMNPAYEEIYGMPVEEVKASPEAFLETIHPDDVVAVEDAMECLSAGNAVDIEYRVNPQEHYKRWVWVQGQPITQDGEIVRIAGFTRDITDRKRRERQLFVMDNLLRHNLRNDLNVILGTADLIEGTVPEVDDQTAIIRRTAENLLRSAQKQREIIELVTGQERRERIDLQEVVSESIATVRDRYPTATVSVTTFDAVTVRGRPELKAAVIELLENAIQNSEAVNPTVMVRLQQVGHHAELSVEDEATPIPPIEAAVLKGEHEMTDVYHSSGLGFWLVYWSVELSNGTISVHSEDGRGNRITVSLPRAME